MKKYVACLLIVNSNNEILVVSRKDNPNDFGLPGGKQDDGEDICTTAKRELFEETGLTIDTVDLKPIYLNKDSNNFNVLTFFIDKYQGTINTSEKGVVKWVNKETLLKGSFANYNKEVLNVMNM